MSLGTQITATLSKLKSINIKFSARVCLFYYASQGERKNYKKLLAQTIVKKVSTVIFFSRAAWDGKEPFSLTQLQRNRQRDADVL